MRYINTTPHLIKTNLGYVIKEYTITNQRELRVKNYVCFTNNNDASQRFRSALLKNILSVTVFSFFIVGVSGFMNVKPILR